MGLTVYAKFKAVWMSHVKLPTFKVRIVPSAELEKSCQGALAVLQLGTSIAVHRKTFPLKHSVAHVLFYFYEPQIRNKT